MANKQIFKSPGKHTTDYKNAAGGLAFEFNDKHALAQMSVTGCFNSTFHVSAQDQVDKVLQLCDKVSSEFIAKLALYARREGLMKDMPAYLLAYLSTRASVDNKRVSDLFEEIFDEIINNGRMLRTFVQIMRSGAVGRKSFGRMSKRMINKWLQRNPEVIFRNSFGKNPSFKDIILMTHARGSFSKTHENLYRYLLNLKCDKECLPPIVREYEDYINGGDHVPNLAFEVLAPHAKTEKHWMAIANTISWEALRMNINTFQRHSLLEKGTESREVILSKFKDFEGKMRTFPYRMYIAYKNFKDQGLSDFRDVLHDAFDYSVRNIPEIGPALVCVDISSSMISPVTGVRGTNVKSNATCAEVAALTAASVFKRNPGSEVILFNHTAQIKTLERRDSAFTITESLVSAVSGSTNCASALRLALEEKMKYNTVIFLSDNESWLQSGQFGVHRSYYHGGGNSSEFRTLWDEYKKFNPEAKLVLIDLSPNQSSPAKESADILNVGGFSDSVFEVIGSFINRGSNFVKEIEKIDI